MPKSFNADNIYVTIQFWSCCIKNQYNRNLFACRIIQEIFELQIDYIIIFLSADFFQDYISLEGGCSRRQHLEEFYSVKLISLTSFALLSSLSDVFFLLQRSTMIPEVLGVIDVLNITGMGLNLQTALGNVLQCKIDFFNFLFIVKTPN